MWVEIIYANHLLPTVVVTPLAGVWVEITEYNKDGVIDLVTPLAGVWVEMDEHFFGEHRKSSLPLRECGLKSLALLKSMIVQESLPLRECGLKSVQMVSQF